MAQNTTQPANHRVAPAPRWAASKIMSRVRLPVEVVEHILSYAFPSTAPRPAARSALIRSAAMRPPYYSPPPFRRCPLMQLPTELRRAIFAESLVAKHMPILPKCADEGYYSSNIPSKWPKRNEMSNLMTLNKTIRDEIAEVIYEERTFVIHVHEGLLNGGIEFTDACRQPLHFQDCPSDDRFWKFSNGEKDFGFRRLKKICVQIYPSTEENTRHCAINTFFTNLALVRQLDRSGEDEHRITSLTIRFMDSKRTGGEQGRRAIQRAEYYWWDPEKNQPRETSIHGNPDVEIVLRPFANLTGCHSVTIEMPPRLANDARIAVFVRDLKASMTSRYGLSFTDDDLDRNIEAGRSAMEDYTFSLKHGVKHREVQYLTEDEAQDRMDIDDGDHDSSEPSTKRQKKSLFHTSTSSFEDATMMYEEDLAFVRAMQDEEDDLARAIEESLMSTPIPKEDDEVPSESYQDLTSPAPSDVMRALRQESIPATQASSSAASQSADRSWAQVAAQPLAPNTSRLLGGHVEVPQNCNSSGISGQQLGLAGPNVATSIVGISREQTPTPGLQAGAYTQSRTRSINMSRHVRAYPPRDGEVPESPPHPFAQPQVPSNGTAKSSVVHGRPVQRFTSAVDDWINNPSVPWTQSSRPFFHPDNDWQYTDMNDRGKTPQASNRPGPNADHHGRHQ